MVMDLPDRREGPSTSNSPRHHARHPTYIMSATHASQGRASLSHAQPIKRAGLVHEAGVIRAAFKLGPGPSSSSIPIVNCIRPLHLNPANIIRVEHVQTKQC